MTRFDLAYSALVPFFAPVIFYRRMAYGKYRQSLPGMFGRFWRQHETDPWRNGSIWLHAVSVGECVAAKALVPKIKARFPDFPFVLTTVTETGQATAVKLFQDTVDEITYYPADFSWVVERFLQCYRPRLLVIMETELWPNALEAAYRRACAVVVANGRISEKSFRSYFRLRRLFERPLSKISAFCMQTPADAERIIQIGAPAERVFVTGNCKFDVTYSSPSPARLAELREMLRLEPSRPVIVAGSTHAGEEEIILSAFRKLKECGLAAQLVLVPRHPERFESVWQLVAKSGFSAFRVSKAETLPATARNSATTGADVILVDQMGILAELYAIATVAVVAGSLVPGIGGHNLLEAAIHGVPVVYGPYMEKQPELTRILSPENGGIMADGESLADTLFRLMRDEQWRSEIGRKVRVAAHSQQGAAERTLEIIVEATKATGGFLPHSSNF
ncbi:MAG: 3-deoxy-D-manno-octulosonic acid transferase [Candidatus Sumerlaeaceae bacterium]|nr:3-deoxy-D-manno-octulosonic acid transferase [Candidatus Sumerlaeaceae bacterium]